jgi:hypothetical protein
VISNIALISPPRSSVTPTTEEWGGEAIRDRLRLFDRDCQPGL